MNEALRAAFDAIDSYPQMDEKQALVAAKLRALLRGYDARWGVPEFEVLSVEETVSSDLYNPTTQAKSRTFKIAGKLDMVVLRDGKRVLFDHKSSSEDIKDPAGPYWKQLVIEAQPSHYALLEWLNGRKVDEIVWDVIHKPDIRPKQISKKDREWTQRSKFYFGFPVSGESLVEMEKTERETLEMYEYRLAHDCITERPQHYFQRRTVPRMDSEVHEHAVELWDWSQEVITARRTGRHGKNAGNCMNYSRPCVFLGVCSGHDDIDSEKWKRKNQVHSELVLIGTDGRDVLTNSRLTTFKNCRRLHLYKYEIGVEKVDEEEAESLYMGTWLPLSA